MLTKFCVNQIKWYQFIQNQVKSVLVKEFLFHSRCLARNGNFLKMRVNEIRVKRIRVNQGIGVPLTFLYGLDFLSAGYSTVKLPNLTSIRKTLR